MKQRGDANMLVHVFMKPFAAAGTIFIDRVWVIMAVLSGFCFNASAQIFSNQVKDPMSGDSKIISDTTKKKKNTDDRIRIFSYQDEPAEKNTLDTSINYLHRNPLLGTWIQDIGNLGLAAQQRFFCPDTTIAMMNGLSAFRFYHFNRNNTPFYNTTRPYTSLYYRLGSQQEQLLELFHTQNIHERWNVAIRYMKVGSPGFYKLQKSNNDHLGITSHYRSLNRHYDLKASFFYNKMQQDENGGILNEEDLLNPAYNNKRLMPVHAQNIGGRQNNSSIKNYAREWEGQLTQTYYFHVTAENDSLPNQGLALQNELYSQQGLHRFRDYYPDSSFYGPLAVASFSPGDSLNWVYRFRRTGTAFQLQGTWKMAKQLWRIKGGWGIEHETPDNGSFSPAFNNTYWQASLTNLAFATKAWQWQAHVKQYLSGNVAGNTWMNVRVGQTGKQQSLFAFAQQSIQQAPYTYSYLASNYAVLEHDWKSMSTTKIGLEYALLKFGLKTRLQYTLLGNYIFRDSTWQTRQMNQAFGVWQAHIIQSHHIGSIYFENDWAFQHVEANRPLKLPSLLWRANLSYRNKLFKQKLGFTSGVEVFWHSPYYANNYIPYLADFVLQMRQKVSNQPRFTAYAQIKVKRFRGSSSVSDIQQLIWPNAILFPTYAAPNLAIHFSLHWAFVN